jgi:hypothetical protein
LSIDVDAFTGLWGMTSDDLYDGLIYADSAETYYAEIEENFRYVESIEDIALILEYYQYSIYDIVDTYNFFGMSYSEAQ